MLTHPRRPPESPGLDPLPIPTRPADPGLVISLLGPVEVLSGGTPLSLSPMELNLLVILALSPGVAVSTEQLIDHLWGAALPSAPRTRIQGLVSGLRRKVGDAVLTRHPGYLVDPGRVRRDLDDLERLLETAREAPSPEDRLRALAAAQALWRGEPLGGISTDGVAPQRARLGEERLALLEARAEAELAVGNHRSVTGLLATAVAEHPLREHLAGLYITALYRSNRQADALAVYHELRERLAEELGSDVCPELRELYAQILRGEGLPEPAGAPPGGTPGPESAQAVRLEAAPIPAPPAQLPPRDGLFLGRGAELALLTGTASGRGGAVAVVSGPGGLGKTALVVEWAHRAAEQFPDGQLFLELGDQMTAQAAVASALVALGADVPEGLADRIGRYRTVLRGRRVLVVADGVTSAQQVLALVPPTHDGQLVVTARSRMVSLAAHHAVSELVLPPLPRATAAELLERAVGPERLADPRVDDLVEWCGGWPLLLRHVGARLAARPSQDLATFVRELETGASGVAPHGDPRSVDEALARAYAGLTPAAAQLFERLALHGGRGCLHVAAAAAGTSPERARRLLDELTGVHFLVEAASGEFRCHEVIRRYGDRLARQQEWTEPEPLPPGAAMPVCSACRDVRLAQIPAPPSPQRSRPSASMARC